MPNTPPLESAIQSKVIKHLESKGYLVVKLLQTNCNGIADLLVLQPNGVASFIEVKRPGAKLRPLQEFRQKQIEALGFEVLVIHDFKEIIT